MDSMSLILMFLSFFITKLASIALRKPSVKSSKSLELCDAILIKFMFLFVQHGRERSQVVGDLHNRRVVKSFLLKFDDHCTSIGPTTLHSTSDNPILKLADPSYTPSKPSRIPICLSSSLVLPSERYSAREPKSALIMFNLAILYSPRGLGFGVWCLGFGVW